MRALPTGSLVLLIDGFDELGSQSWSKDSAKLKVIRSKSLEGVKDLLSRTTAGVMVSGREHYFNSNAEMFASLGLDASSTVLLRCKSEFTEEETHQFFGRIQAVVVVPPWLPRRPLICQTIADLSADELDQMFGLGEDEFAFWDHFIKVLSIRDARIHASFDAETIEAVLTRLARLTRTKPANTGPIVLEDLQEAFESVVGKLPVEEAAVMLQRLPGLGRVESGSNDRQFIDMYILDGLRAKDIVHVRSDESVIRALAATTFSNPLDDLGQRILAHNIQGRDREFLQLAKRCAAERNKIMACDIVAALLRIGASSFDFERMQISEGEFIRLDMSRTLPVSLEISDSIFGTLILPAVPPPNTTINDSLATRIFGIASASAIPAWLTNFKAESYDSVENVAHIRKIGLDPNHEILVTIVRKTFFQKGAGRKEEALLRGLGQVGAAPGVSDRILNILMRNGILTRFRGDQGWVYAPERSHTDRMGKLLYELRVSQDPIWIEVGRL